MRVHVDEPRHEHSAADVDDCRAFLRDPLSDLSHDAVLDEDIRLFIHTVLRVDDATALE